jgi:TRL-like protein family
MAPVAIANKRRTAMRKLFVTAALASVVIVFMTGCAGITPIAGGTGGVLFTQTDAAVAVGSANGADKVGTAESTAIICFATGDSSISKAMANGGITKIHHVDCKVFSVLGLYAKYTTVVYGE